MKPFDLEKAKAGAPVCTREGFKARIVCFDVDNDKFPVVALIKDSINSNEYPVSLTKEGRFSYGEADSLKDLFMVVEKKYGWVNLYKAMTDRCIGCVYNTKEEAMSKIVKDGGVIYIDTVKVEWEE